MKLGLNRQLVDQWRTDAQLELSEATEEIKKCLGCSDSKAEKIASGRYPSLPTPLERKALAGLMNLEESQLFSVGAGKSRAS
jgi:hypothetical protein